MKPEDTCGEVEMNGKTSDCVVFVLNASLSNSPDYERLFTPK